MYNLDTPLRDLLDSDEGYEVLEKHLGALLNHPMLETAKSMSLNVLAGYAAAQLPKELLRAIETDLAKIEE